MYNPTQQVTSEWKIVSFAKKENKTNKKGQSATSDTKQSIKLNDKSKTYDPNPGKFPDHLQNLNSPTKPLMGSQQPPNPGKDQETSPMDQISALDQPNLVTLGKRPINSSTKSGPPLVDGPSILQQATSSAKSNTNNLLGPKD